jgi:hypothetical protein
MARPERTEAGEHPTPLSAITPRRAPPPTGRPRERKPIPGGVFSKIEPLRLDDSMTRTDLAWSLQHLTFDRSTDCHLLTIDRGVRDFLLNAIKRHG